MDRLTICQCRSTDCCIKDAILCQHSHRDHAQPKLITTIEVSRYTATAALHQQPIKSGDFHK